MTKYVYALCLMIPLVALAQTDKKEQTYSDLSNTVKECTYFTKYLMPESCNMLFKQTHILMLGLEKNKFTQSLFTTEKKTEYVNETNNIKKEIFETSNRQEQAEVCGYLLTLFKKDTEHLNNLKSKDDASTYFDFLKD